MSKQHFTQEYMKRVYRSLLLIIIVEAILLSFAIMSVYKDNSLLFWLSIPFIIWCIIPIIGGFNIIYHYQKDEKEKEL